MSALSVARLGGGIKKLGGKLGGDASEFLDAIIKTEVDSLIKKAEERSKKLAQNQA